MLNYLDTLAALHTRGLNVSLKEYLFVQQVVFKEDIRVAYASVFDAQEFVRNVPLDKQQAVLLGEYLCKAAGQSRFERAPRGLVSRLFAG